MRRNDRSSTLKMLASITWGVRGIVSLSSHLSDVRWPCRIAPCMESHITPPSRLLGGTDPGSSVLGIHDVSTVVDRSFCVGVGRSSGRPSGFRSEQSRRCGVDEIKTRLIS